MKPLLIIFTILLYSLFTGCDTVKMRKDVTTPLSYKYNESGSLSSYYFQSHEQCILGLDDIGAAGYYSIVSTVRDELNAIIVPNWEAYMSYIVGRFKREKLLGRESYITEYAQQYFIMTGIEIQMTGFHPTIVPSVVSNHLSIINRVPVPVEIPEPTITTGPTNTISSFEEVSDMIDELLESLSKPYTATK